MSDPIEPTDEEIFAIDKLQAELQNRFTGREIDLRTIPAIRDEITTKFANIGFKVTVGFKSMGTGGRLLCPDVTIVGRTDASLAEFLKTETDVERRRWDALQRPSVEMKKLTRNIQLLE